MISLLLLSAIAAAVAVNTNVIEIHGDDEFLKFANNVNMGTTYEGTTVCLGYDVNLAGKVFDPIGKDISDVFRGTFNGQGHTFKNVVINTTSEYVGIFGLLYGATIKNFIIEKTCSITGSYALDLTTVGSAIGWCNSYYSACNVLNIINMASVTYTGDGVQSLFFGGIVGNVQTHNYESTVKNCANYGTITHTGQSTYSYTGGIVGKTDFSVTRHRIYVHNCFNYGTIVDTDWSTPWYLRIGGIVGYSECTDIDNCVGYGDIMTNRTSQNFYIGGIVGSLNGDKNDPVTLSHCYWSEHIDHHAYGFMADGVATDISIFNENLELNETVVAGKYSGDFLIDALNGAVDYYALREYTRWFGNLERYHAMFTIKDHGWVAVTSQVILPPEVTDEGTQAFDGWYADRGYTVFFPHDEIIANSVLYGRLKDNTKNYTIRFDARGGSPAPEPIVAQFGTVVKLPRELSKNDTYTVDHWETEYGDRVDWDYTVHAHDATLYAVWIRNLIHNASDFYYFVNVVNNGMTFEGRTIYVGYDIDFEGAEIEPIGRGKDGFRGTFDGRGHSFKNLKVNGTTNGHTGLFGLTAGMTIKNLVLDETCTVTNTNDGDYACIGAFIGECSGVCTVTKCVNKGSVTYTRDGAHTVYMGGITGGIGAGSVVTNCTNYGEVTHMGNCTYSYMGGVVGIAYYNMATTKIGECNNYGTIKREGETVIGVKVDGIVGSKSVNTVVEKCFNYGKVDSAASSKMISIALLLFVALFI